MSELGGITRWKSGSCGGEVVDDVGSVEEVSGDAGGWAAIVINGFRVASAVDETSAEASG